MTARRKRSARTKGPKSQSESRPVVEEEGKEPMQDQDNVTMDTHRSMTTRQVWKLKRPCYTKLQATSGTKAIVPIKSMPRSFLPQFRSAERLAEWVFAVAKHRPMQLNLQCCERSDQVRDALLRQFHRWPETKVSQATNRYNTQAEGAQQRCQEQVQLYLQELRGKLVGAANALFWLNVLQPLTHPATVSRQEVRDILMALVDELKSVDGVYEQLARKSERLWAVLTLPLTLEPLFRGVSTLALCGHQAAALEAMQLLTMFAEECAAFPGRQLPVGVSVVASVGTFAPLLDIASLSDLPEAFRHQLSKPLVLMVRDWVAVVDEVLEVLEKSLTRQWASREREPCEEELKMALQRDLQSAFERLSHALATDQLYALRKAAGERANCLDVSIARARGLLLVQAQQRQEKWT
ncbi:hypothetical protein PHYPSEUDO_011048 [Phytophthora pseudosyringae]|uniref:Uncharacterized protein n=1 Tax=Phytophthora pseudosyringae TaxID=221518 RepID=A0A8T1V9T3_9STRA|nr:hypothetical protein PHYPSEUDO_011048 [Phytophthora pseudosyringae]